VGNRASARGGWALAFFCAAEARVAAETTREGRACKGHQPLLSVLMQTYGSVGTYGARADEEHHD